MGPTGAEQEYEESIQPKEEIPKPELNQQALELSTQPIIIEQLSKYPSLVEQLKNGEHINVEIGTNAKPTYPFQINFLNDLTEERLKTYQVKIADFFLKNPKLGLMLNMGPENVAGLLQTQEFDSTQQALAAFQSLATQLAQINGSSETDFLVSAVPNNHVGIYPLGKHLWVNVQQSAGLTNLSWATKGLQHKDLPKDNTQPNIKWVTTQQMEALRATGVLLRDNDLIGQVKPLEVSPSPEKADVKTYVYSLDYPAAEQSIAQTVARNSEQTAIEPTNITPSQINDLNGHFYRNHLEQHPEWGEQFRQNGYIETKLAGEHIALKFDYSGMSKLVANGVNPVELMMNLFGKIIPALDNEIKPENFLVSLEGDAVTVFAPTENQTTTNLCKQLVTIQEGVSKLFTPFMQKAIQDGVLGGNLSEHTMGLKMISTISDQTDPATVRLFKGGIFHIGDSQFTHHEDEAEKLAKQDGYNGTYLLPSTLTPEEEGQIFGQHRFEKTVLSDGNTAYRVATPSILEQIFSEEVMPKLSTDAQQTFKQSGELVTSLIHDKKISGISNNILFAAQMMHGAMLAGKNQLPEDVSGKILSAYSKKTSAWLTTIWDSLHNRNPQTKLSPDAQEVLSLLQQLQKYSLQPLAA